VELFVFAVCALIVLGGAIGVISFPNPVHAALSLVATLFGVAVLFVAQEAHFLAAVQVIVYAGAIVILFLFVIMLLGVDRSETIGVEPIAGQRPLAVLAAGGVLAGVLVALLLGTDSVTGATATDALRVIDPTDADYRQIGRLLFTDYILAFELTAILLTIAVVGAVMLSRRDTGEIVDVDSYVREAPTAPKLRRSTASDEAAPGDDAAAEEVDA
jgi:NADH-quinone oxidoreductase subunit J